MGCKKGKTLFNLFYLCFIIRTGMSEIIRERESCDKMMSSVFSLAVLHSLFHTLREAAPRSGFRCVGGGGGGLLCRMVFCSGVCPHWPRVCVSPCPCWPIDSGCSALTSADGRQWVGLGRVWPVAVSRRPSCRSAAPPTGSTLQRWKWDVQLFN